MKSSVSCLPVHYVMEITGAKLPHLLQLSEIKMSDIDGNKPAFAAREDMINAFLFH